MAHAALLCIVCMLFPQQNTDDNEELRRECFDRIIELSDARDLERAAILARVSKKMFPKDSGFEDFHQQLQGTRFQYVPEFANHLQANQIATAQYRLDKFKDLDYSSRTEKMNELVDSILEQIDPDYWFNGRTIIHCYPSKCLLIIYTSRENHNKIQEIIGKEAFQKTAG